MRKAKIITLVIIFFLTTGCLNYTELNDIGIINTIGITKNNNSYIININMLTPTEKNLENNKTFEVKAESISEAFDKLYLLTEKDINLSHLELLLLNKSLNMEDYKNIFSFFLNRNDSRNTFNTIIIDNYSKDNIFKYDSKDINSLIETNSKQDGIVIPKTFDEVIEDVLNTNISYIPTIQINNNIEILGYRSIYKESKLLSKKESISYNFITDKIIKCNLVDENFNIKIDNNITTINIDKNIIKIIINSTLTNYSKSKDIESFYNKRLKLYLHNFIENNDLGYFKNLIKKHDYNYYKKNDLSKIKFEIIVSSKINKEVKTSD